MTKHPNTKPDNVPGSNAGPGEGDIDAGNQAEQADDSAKPRTISSLPAGQPTAGARALRRALTGQVYRML